MTPVGQLAGAHAPIWMWTRPSEVESAALDQLRTIANLPYIHHHVAVMPDVHLGKGATVGSVVAMRDAVSPAAVGVDIGCGMAALRTSLTAADLPDDLGALRSAVEAAIPVGPLGHAAVSKRVRGYGELWSAFADLHPSVAGRMDRAMAQMGTLGSGNHFIELCLDTTDAVWLMLHSGSRNIGKELAETHIRVAKRLPHNTGLPDRDLAVFLAGTPQMAAYRRDLEWAQAYARRNRETMLALYVEALRGFFPRLKAVQEVNCLSGETLVLTRDGSRPIRDLADGYHELLTTGGDWIKAPVKSFGYQRLYEVIVGRYGQEKIIRATENHRWLLRAKVAHNRIEATTVELRVGDRLDYAFPRRPHDLRPSRAGVARGFVFGDGSVPPAGGARAYFCGKKDEALLPFFDVTFGKPRTYYYETKEGGSRYLPLAEAASRRLAAGDVKSFRRLDGLPRAWKEYPRLDDPADELYGWLAGYFAADGDVGKTGRPSIWSAKVEDLEFVKAVCGVLGIWTLPIRRRARKGNAKNVHPVYVMGISRADLTPEFFVHDEHRRRWAAGRNAVERRGWTVRQIRETEAVEEVFCAVVDGTHAFTLDGNILTGNCHHNYVSAEHHYGADVLVTRKGAISARTGEYGIIPGSMGTRSYIVRGLGNAESFHSASHGAGRRMSRNQAKKMFTTDDLAAQTAGVECRKDAGVVDEIPAAYKDIDQVIAYQHDLVEVAAELHAVLCVKG